MTDYCNFDRTISLKFSDATLCNIVCQWLVAGQWFSSGTPLSWIHVFLFKGTNILYWKFYYLLHTLFSVNNIYWINCMSYNNSTYIWKNVLFQYLIYSINNTCFTQIMYCLFCNRHDIAKILLKVVLNTITLPFSVIFDIKYR
jgi:hypothetical protein